MDVYLRLNSGRNVLKEAGGLDGNGNGAKGGFVEMWIGGWMEGWVGGWMGS